MNAVRIGFAGCGAVTARIHLPALRRVRGAVVTALADVDQRRCEEVGAAWGIRGRHADAAALAADPAVDLVAVCVPPAEQVPVALAALEGGRHVFVEKPVGATAEGAGELVAAAASLPGRVVAVGFNLRHHRQVRAARGLLAGERLGRVAFVRTAFTTGSRSDPSLPDWRLRRADGGGVLWDLAVHHADLWRHLLGDEIVEVSARVRDEPVEDDAAVLTARTAGGTLVVASFAQGTGDAHEVEVAGDRGVLRTDLLRGDGLRVALVGRPGGGPGRRAREALRSAADLPRQIAAARHGGDLVMSYAAQWTDVVEAVRSGRRPAATPEDGRRAVEIVEAAARSADERRPAAVGEPAPAVR